MTIKLIDIINNNDTRLKVTVHFLKNSEKPIQKNEKITASHCFKIRISFLDKFVILFLIYKIKP